MLRNYSRILTLILSVMIISFCVSGCRLPEEGVFTENGGLYDNVVPVTPTPADEETEESGDTTDAEISDDIGEFEDNSDDVYEYIEPDKATAVHVTMNVKDYGVIKLELYKNIAPITVDNFVSLAESGFYDGLIFHRVIKDFVIQGGDPKGDGTGGSDKNIVGEFLINGINNSLSHKRGVISMARNSYDYNSASSQFFICHKDNPDSLDGQYAGFGVVTEGMDIVDKIAAVETDAEDKPLKNVVIESVNIDK